MRLHQKINYAENKCLDRLGYTWKQQDAEEDFCTYLNMDLIS